MALDNGRRQYQKEICAKNAHISNAALHALRPLHTYLPATNIVLFSYQQVFFYFLDQYSEDSTTKTRPIVASCWSRALPRLCILDIWYVPIWQCRLKEIPPFLLAYNVSLPEAESVNPFRGYAQCRIAHSVQAVSALPNSAGEKKPSHAICIVPLFFLRQIP